MARPKKDDIQRRLISARIDETLYEDVHVFAVTHKRSFHGVYDVIEQALKEYMDKRKGTTNERHTQTAH